MIGVKRGTVRLEQYDATWPKAFADEEKNLREVFGADLPIEHIGSTAIPGLLAKPLIDIQVGLPRLHEATRFIPYLEQLGYTYVPERDKADEVFLPKGPTSNRTHYLHIVEIGSKRWINTLTFRDYLRAHEGARDEYAALKQRLVLQYANDRYTYTEAKTKFVEDILERARRESR